MAGMGELSQEVSRYNEASFQIYRLHECWVKSNNNARIGNFDAWRWELDIIWRELIADVRKRLPNQEDVVKRNDEIKAIIKKAKTKEDIYEALNTRHEFLKWVQDEVGKGGSYEQYGSDEFD